MRSCLRILALIGPLFLTALAPAEVEQASPPPVANQDTPRNAAFQFITLAREGRWDEAAGLLQWPHGQEMGEVTPDQVARALKLMLDDNLWLDFKSIPGDEANARPEPVSLGTLVEGSDELDVQLIRDDADDWVVSVDTVKGIPPMARAMGVWWITFLPEFLVNTTVFEIELWQWVALLLVAAIVIAVGWGASRLMHHSAHMAARKGLGIVRESIVVLAAPVGVMLALLAMRIASRELALSIPAKANLAIGSRAVMVLAVAWGVARWLRIFTLSVERTLGERGIHDAGSIVRVGRAVATALVYLLGLSIALQALGLDLGAVVAGLGIGTAAIALASQQTLANLFGGASVIADKVLKPGDTCAINGTVATVERIGLRSTTLRTVDRTVLVVANGDLAQSRVEKLSERDGFRYSAVLGLRYETSAASMKAILEGLRARLAADALVDPASVRVNFLAFGSSSLDVDVKALVRTTDVAVYRSAVERLNLDIMEIVQGNGSGFAFPSQTVYLARDGAPQAR
jgi:MscS family membrane protein